MTSTLYDFAIIGYSPAAKLLAGLLARDHKRRCVLLGENRALFRLPQSQTIAVSPLTRPEHWSLLANTVPETLKLLSRIGARSCARRTKASFTASDEMAKEALSHVRTMAAIHGHNLETTNPVALPPNSLGFTFIDALELDPIVLEPHLSAWLRALGVISAPLDGFKLLKDGSATLKTAGQTYAFRQTILFDDQAIIDHLPVSQWPRFVRRQTYSSLLFAPPNPPALPFAHDLGSGAVHFEMGGGNIASISPGHFAQATADAANLPMINGAELIGQTEFTRLVPTDGLPAFGRVGLGSGADVIIGAEGYAAFLVTALARWIGAVPEPAEAAYFSERLVTRAAHKTPDVMPSRLMSLS